MWVSWTDHGLSALEDCQAIGGGSMEGFGGPADSESTLNQLL